MKYLFFLVLLCGIQVQVFAQNFSIKGTVLEEGKRESLPFVNILLLSPVDSSQLSGTVTDIEGRFELSGIRKGDYLLKIQLMGYRDFFQVIQASSNINLGNLFISEEATDLNEVVIEARRSTGMQKGDTTQFNADAFKTMRDASAQALIEKLPGVSSENGILQAQGENIAQILVDGKPFFGNDVTAALQNIPAEMIDRIEIFDQKSEKAQLSGFDDGERLKTINIITKPNRRKGQFGKTTVGYGSDDRYLGGASVNIFNEDTRLTLTGLSNNVNILNYSSDPNVQTGETPQQGIITTNFIGANYSDLWGEKIKVTGSYVYTVTENVGLETRLRDFVTTDQSNKFYAENRRDVRVNRRHQANLRLEYNINERNRILYIPRFSARFENENSGFFGETSNGINLINAVENNRIGRYEDFDLFNRFFYSHKFKKPGRTVTARFNLTNGWNIDNSERNAINTFFEQNGEVKENLNQITNRDRRGNSWNTRFSYTEPIGNKGQMEFEYSVGNRKNDSEQLLFNVLSEIGNPEAMVLDTALSNSFLSSYLTHGVEIGYQYQTEKMKFQAELEYQDASLKNDQIFPVSEVLNRNFKNTLPTLRWEYKFSSKSNIQIDYDTWTNEPQVWQLQKAINNNNPLQLRTGNPDLDQAYSNQIRLRFRGNEPDKDRNWFVFAQGRLTNDFIANSILIADAPMEVAQGVVLQQGAQLNRPVNLDGFRELRSWMSYGFPLGFIKSNFNINAGLGITQRPGQINDQIGFNNSNRLSTGFNLSSSISENIDFNIWSRSSFNNVRNTLNSNLNSEFFQQRMRLNFNWIIWNGIIYRLDLNHQINSGLAEGFDTNFTLVNMSVGKKIFNKQRGEISIMAYDLLGQNANVRRNITETFVEDYQSNVLQQYVMVSFTYNLRRFSKGMDEKVYSDMYSEN